MAQKLSRYRDVAEVVVPDATGREFASKAFRPLPETAGTFRHTLDSGDRLDQLAYKYYGQPLHWWTICDANGEFLSPLALLGREPLICTRFNVEADAGTDWTATLGTLEKLFGVTRVSFSEQIELVPTQVSSGGASHTIFAQRVERAVLVTYNRLSTTLDALATHLDDGGLRVVESAELEPLGRDVIIPPKPSA